MADHPIIIIGGGVVGVCAAYELARAGERVTLLERDSIAGAASYGNAGQMAYGHPPIPRPGLAVQALKWMFNPQSPLHISPKAGWSMIPWLWRFWRSCNVNCLNRSMVTLAEMGRQTKPMFDDIIERESISCDFRRSGIMDVFRTEAGAEAGRHFVSFMQRYDYDVVWLEGSDVESREPAFNAGVVGAAFNRQSTSLDPANFVRGIAKAAERYGAELRPNTPVRRLIIRDGAIEGVELESGERIESHNVALTAGIWSSDMAREVGVRIPMQAGKGYHRDIEQDEPRLNTPCVLAERFVACTPIDGRLRLAGTLEFTGVNQNMRRERLEALSIGAREYLKGVENKSPISEWCGLRPCAADGLPIIGMAPRVKGLCVATGHAMLGMTLGPITGSIIHRLLTGQAPTLDIAPMRVDRF